MAGDRDHADAGEIGDCAGEKDRERAPGFRFCIERRDSDQVGGNQDRHGPWRPAKVAANNARYSWKLFTYEWEGATPGEHTLVSRATDVEGTVQPEPSELKRKKTFLEDNAQFPRKVMIG